MSDKPLHVQVAEALGCKVGKPAMTEGVFFCGCAGREHSQAEHMAPLLLEYDTDWSATGPLIERLRISLVRDHYDGEWTAESDGVSVDGWYTPLPAICHLLLALHAAGKLAA